MTLERALAQWAAVAPVSNMDPAPRLAQDALVDIIACIIAGSGDESTQSVIGVAKNLGGGKALALGSNLRLPAPWAALVGGTAAHALDFDDNFGPATTHATAVLAPALFVLADERDSPGAAVCDAYIVGLELQARIGRLMNPNHYERGWHGTSTVGAIGTAGACARLLGLAPEKVLAAMSIAFSMASGSKKQFGSMMKPIHAGLAAKNAVLAALMAEAGIDGNEEPLGGRWGFVDLYDGSTEKESLRLTSTERVEPPLAIDTDGLMAKRFPCCGAAHRTLDGIAEIREKYRVHPDSVDRIEVFIPAFARANLRFDEPQNEMEARFSLTYCGARVLQSGHLRLSDLTPRAIQDPATRDWFSRFDIRIKPGSVAEELGPKATPAITRIFLKNGRVHEAAISAPKGSRGSPLTESELRDKFNDCCRWAGKERNADQLFELARSIHRLAHFSEFSAAFSKVF